MKQIDFSCETISLPDVLQCSLQLNKTELAVLRGLDEVYKAEEVSEANGLSLNYAQRILKSLVDKGLVERRAINLDSGGYIYVYDRLPEEEIVGGVLETLNEWCKKARTTLKEEGLGRPNSR